MIHSGQLKSGPWLLQASLHEALDIRPGIQPPGRGLTPEQQPRQQPAPSQPTTEGPWLDQDWRTGNGGAFHSNVRPPMSSDVPHPHDVLKPGDKRLQTLAQGQDPIHDPWNVLGGSGQTFENLVQNQVGHMQQATPEHNYEGRVWYRAAHEGTKDLADKTIGDHPKTVAIMSALSPKTDWDENVEKGHHFLTHYTGDPNDPNFILPGMQGPVDKAKAIWHDPEGAHKQILSGPKTQAFAGNILDPTEMREPRPGEHDDAGYYQHPQNPHTQEPDWRMHPDQDSTMDTHHVRMTNHAPGQSLGGMLYDTPPYFNKKISVNGQKFDPSYDLQARANWEATRRHNAAQADPERHITPKQSQAIAWTKFKNDVDTDPDKKKHLQPPPGVQPKTMGPLTNPIPRYQKEVDPDWWDDPRRPKVDLRQTPNWYRRPAARIATADNGTIWGSMLGDYIRRNPQHRGEQQAPKPTPPIPIKPRRTRAPRKTQHPTASLWYTSSGGEDDPLVGNTFQEQKRPDEHQTDPITASRWYRIADIDGIDAQDKDKPGSQPSQGAGGMAGGDIGGANGSVTTPSLSQWSGGGSTDPHASPSMPTYHPSGGGYSGGGGTSGGTYSGGGAIGGTPINTGGGSVPLIKNPDGSYTSSDPNWAHLINRESGGHNIIQAPSTHDVNSGGNEAFGLFQITPGTWSAHGGQGSVYNSTPEQQAQVAADIIRKNPSGSDWGAGLSGRENASGLASGVTPLPKAAGRE